MKFQSTQLLSTVREEMKNNFCTSQTVYIYRLHFLLLIPIQTMSTYHDTFVFCCHFQKNDVLVTSPSSAGAILVSWKHDVDDPVDI